MREKKNIREPEFVVYQDLSTAEEDWDRYQYYVIERNQTDFH